MKFLTEETPGKVAGLLAASLTSMFFLFAVCLTNANFSQTEKPFPDTFNPDHVVSMIDYAASGYSSFLEANLFGPARQSYAVYQDNLAYVIDNASPSILKITGLTALGDPYSNTNVAVKPEVAGASTQVVYSNLYPPHSGGVFSLFFGN